jgi:Zn-dependent peptidase ImmA (M78 family)
MPKVNPEVLRWARETAGFELDEAAAKLDLSAARGKPGAERLADLEAGKADPTRPLLLRMAKQYRRPLVAFYLSSPPKKGNRGQDFRTLPEGSSVDDEATLDALLRDFLSRQAIIRAALEEEEDRPPMDWVGSASLESSVENIVGKIRERLDFPLEDFRGAPSVEDAFALLREHVEATGVFVVLASNLGSHHTTLGVDVFRGLAVADPVAPLIVVNDQDSRTAWSFTLLHELVHLWLGFTGVSGGTFDREVERFCNAAASEFLLPASEFQQFPIRRGVTSSELQSAITEFARARKVSRSMIAYRLFLDGRIAEREWRTLAAAFRREWIGHRERQRETSRGESGGPSYYVVRRHRLGNNLLRTTSRLLSAGALTTAKAAHVLGVKPNNVGTLMAGTSRASRGAA